VQARIFTTRFEEFPAINAAWEQAFAGSTRPPARTSVGVAALPLGASVEIEFAFYADDAS
jgi:2-iminobutanoate/2-iminopropanoate deaminase